MIAAGLLNITLEKTISNLSTNFNFSEATFVIVRLEKRKLGHQCNLYLYLTKCSNIHRLGKKFSTGGNCFKRAV